LPGHHKATMLSTPRSRWMRFKMATSNLRGIASSQRLASLCACQIARRRWVASAYSSLGSLSTKVMVLWSVHRCRAEAGPCCSTAAHKPNAPSPPPSKPADSGPDAGSPSADRPSSRHSRDSLPATQSGAWSPPYPPRSAPSDKPFPCPGPPSNSRVGPGRDTVVFDSSFPRPAPPNRTCALPRIRLSTRSRVTAEYQRTAAGQGDGTRAAR